MTLKKKLSSFLKFLLLICMLLCVIVPRLTHRPLLNLISDKPVCFYCDLPHVIHDYYDATGISKEANSLEVAIEIYGEPISVEERPISSNGITVYYRYENFSIIFYTEDSISYIYYGFALHTPVLEIRNDIHVGSTRKQIINAYSKCNSYSYYDEYSKLGDAYYDWGGEYLSVDLLLFHYNQNDIVTEIIYIP